jgi:ABC-type glycerol-3-phosphate transport system permease component
MAKLYKTLFGLIMVGRLYHAFCGPDLPVFIASIPSEIDEAAIIDGASPFQVHNVICRCTAGDSTVIVTSAVGIYNDCGPLYFLPGSENVTAVNAVYIHEPVQLAVELVCGCARHYRSALIMFMFFNARSFRE